MVPDTVKNDIQKIADALLNAQTGDTPLTVTGGGGGTEYTEGATDASITGSAMLWEDTSDTLRPVSAAKPLPVEIVAGAGSGGTASADDADFTAGTTSGTPAMGVYESSPTSVTDGDMGVVGMTADRRQKVLADLSAVDNAVLDAIAASVAAIDTDVTTIIGHVDGIEGLLTTIDADTGNIDTSLNNIETAIQTMDDWDNAASNGASVSGDVAHDSTDAGEPVKVGMKAFSPDGTTPGTAVAENDRTDAKGDLDGRLFTNARHPRWWSFHSDGSSALTDEAVQADPGDGFQIVITEITFSTGAATACNIFFEEGSTKILGPWYLEAVAGRGLMWRGEKHVTASTALTVTTSAAIAQSLDVQGYIQAV